MLQEIKTISSALPYELGRVNSYLLKTEIGYWLIDTGHPRREQPSMHSWRRRDAGLAI